ncbi:hypothetical protein [Ureibacillus manganicus]|uniref:hypothetical protein n=1 Tax=Ureibacillus manganicus TaxID=1266064 RepID=UPI000AAFAC56|nr:hypothetical protein [Ureibacillus manganicus]
MEYFAEITIFVILMIPVYGLLIWSYLEPEESMLFGNRWKYKEDPEPSQKAIRHTKFTSMTAMIGIPVVVISVLSSSLILKLVPVIVILIYIFGALKIFVSEEDS